MHYTTTVIVIHLFIECMKQYTSFSFANNIMLLLLPVCLFILIHILIHTYSCTIQNTILATGATVEANCNLNDCQVAAGALVTAGTKLKGESVSVT